MYVVFILWLWHRSISILFPYTTLFRSAGAGVDSAAGSAAAAGGAGASAGWAGAAAASESSPRSEEHTSELQSRGQLVCRLLLEIKKRVYYNTNKHHRLIYR